MTDAILTRIAAQRLTLKPQGGTWLYKKSPRAKKWNFMLSGSVPRSGDVTEYVRADSVGMFRFKGEYDDIIWQQVSIPENLILSELSGAELKRRENAAYAEASRLNDAMIKAGRGHEKFSETRAKAGEGGLTDKFLAANDAVSAINAETKRRLEYHGSLKPIRKTNPAKHSAKWNQPEAGAGVKRRGNPQSFVDLSVSDMRKLVKKLSLDYPVSYSEPKKWQKLTAEIDVGPGDLPSHPYRLVPHSKSADKILRELKTNPTNGKESVVKNPSIRAGKTISYRGFKIKPWSGTRGGDWSAYIVGSPNVEKKVARRYELLGEGGLVGGRTETEVAKNAKRYIDELWLEVKQELATMKNPAPLGFAIYAKKGNGPRMHFTGKKFSNNGFPKIYARSDAAVAAGKSVIKRFPILRDYRVTVEPARSATRGKT